MPKTPPKKTQRKPPPRIADNTPAVLCAHKALVPTESLVPHPLNPNTHGKEQIEILAKVIRHQGWRSPITVSTRSGYIVAGHGRLLSAKLLGLEKVPVDYQDFASDEDEWAHLVADNRIAELAEIDDKALAQILAALQESGIAHLELSGFDKEALEQLLTADEGPDTFPAFDETISTEHQCPKCKYKWSGSSDAKGE